MERRERMGWGNNIIRRSRKKLVVIFLNKQEQIQMCYRHTSDSQTFFCIIVFCSWRHGHERISTCSTNILCFNLIFVFFSVYCRHKELVTMSRKEIFSHQWNFFYFYFRITGITYFKANSKNKFLNFKLFRNLLQQP